MNGYKANGVGPGPTSQAAIGQNTKNTNFLEEEFDAEHDPSLEWKRSGKVYKEGPNQILPSSAIRTWHADGAVKMNRLGSGDTEHSPISVPHLLKTAVERTPDRVAMAVKREGSWQKMTYQTYLKNVRTVAKAFIALGLEPYHSVCILGFNAPEWFISDLAGIFAGGFATGIYPTSSAEACAYVARDSKAQIVVVEDDAQLEKILEHKHSLPHLKAIVQYSGEPKDNQIYSWSRLMTLGETQSDTILEQRLRSIAVNQCCTLIYTSGTTGDPKGVMLSHDNLIWNAKASCKTLKVWEDGEEFISFLPLCHAGAQIVDLYWALNCSATVYVADRDALRGSLMETMKEIQPTLFLSVPRVWEKMYERMQDVEMNSSWLQQIVSSWAKSVGLEQSRKRIAGVEKPESYAFSIANSLVLSKVRESWGLNRAHIFLCGGAPIKIEMLEYFMSHGIILPELYGMSECSGPHCLGIESQYKLGSVGKPMSGVATKLHECDQQGNGEICMGGRHVLMGYLNLPEMTRETIDQDGWLHSGDIGKFDKDGFMHVTGRIKELVITAGGLNVTPVTIEDNVKEAIPIVSQAVLVGDKRKFLSILLTTEVDGKTLRPLDILHPSTKEWISAKSGCTLNTVQDVRTELYEKKNEKLFAAFQAGIDEANVKAVSRAKRVQKWLVLPEDFSVQGGEFGPTLKLRRPIVMEKYRHLIDELYA